MFVTVYAIIHNHKYLMMGNPIIVINLSLHSVLLFIVKYYIPLKYNVIFVVNMRNIIIIKFIRTCVS